MCALPTPKSSPFVKQVQKIKGEVEAVITRMQKDPKFTPTREQLEGFAEELMDFRQKNKKAVALHETYLKAAVIDLTEVPVMAPQMQRISFLTALKDALHEIDLFLSCY
jgi:hypothetical protein